MNETTTRNTTTTAANGDTVVIKRIFNASRELVFKCIVTPEVAESAVH